MWCLLPSLWPLAGWGGGGEGHWQALGGKEEGVTECGGHWREGNWLTRRGVIRVGDGGGEGKWLSRGWSELGNV